MKKKIAIGFLATLLSFPTSGLFAGPLDGQCIALVHGILGFDDTQGLAGGLVKYWGGLDGYLRSQGAKVTTPGSSATNSIPVRASQIQSSVNTWMTANGCSKVHLMGHSQGGLVIRYMVSNLGFSGKTQTVTTINSLHKGAPMADIVLSVIPSWLQPFANSALGLLAKLVYRDGRPQDVIAMGKSLTVSYVKTFNTNSPNKSGIKYYSYGSQMAWADLIQHPIMALTHPITWAGGLFYGLGGGNDGVVPLNSQKWGTWKGTPSSYWFATGIDHLQATNLAWSGQNFFDVQGWYLNIAKNAKAGL
ncbi:lipase [Leptospira biflexa]|jgi:triacylglycerol lipase|uniref:esterase/lipase family protein n=1 Tax=Leptospira biflexa TaxID=172 RepID=UPI0010915E57|nr:lipase [Leptospira biflexa]TGM47707.1 lipase [Leptospira biflexa]TGM49827.1 lipase [Leptospira biflexa]